MDKLTMAKYFATEQHVLKRQQRYGVLPYTHHLEAVARVLAYFIDADSDLLCACWLHDILEDCEGIKRKELAEMFGERVATLVWAVTNEPGENRAARHAKTYPKIRETPDAILVKLADRIANVLQGGTLVSMYVKEHETFVRLLAGSALSTPGYEHIAQVLWDRLGELIHAAQREAGA